MAKSKSRDFLTFVPDIDSIKAFGYEVHYLLGRSHMVCADKSKEHVSV